ncbi:methyltransferase [Pseudoxanthomonas mexicana]|uniref:methyltransferase n=1 Tax=Pseudoxanthomonas mexicana TaxID=128785 RepID=UPI0028A59294|nr:methyltransferase [Pseudoxanthomonas mexicana]
MRVNPRILTILSNATTEGRSLTLVGQLDRKDYVAANEVIEAAGGKWNRKAKAHVFDGDAADAMEQVLLTGEVTIPQDFGYFPTPPAVVARLVELAQVAQGQRLLEPSAGKGNIATAFKDIATVDAFELLEANVSDLASLGWLNSVERADFLTIEPRQDYDRVVMNPPFEKRADIKHVMHAAKFLKPGGRLVAVMSSGVVFRDDRLATEFRQFVTQHSGKIEELPPESFKSSGTSVNTVIVSFDVPDRLADAA